MSEEDALEVGQDFWDEFVRLAQQRLQAHALWSRSTPRASEATMEGIAYAPLSHDELPLNERWTGGYCLDHGWWFGDGGCPGCAPSDPTSTV